MPLIKDKYRAKGTNTRSKFITREKNKAVSTKDEYSNRRSTFQKQELESLKYKEIDPTGYASEKKSQGIEIPEGLISGVKLNTPNSPINILTLNQGESLKDIIISHYAASGSSVVISLHWSITPINNLTFTTADGVISATAGGTIYRLLTDTFVVNSTLSLNSNNMFDSINNINKTIYFYAVASARGPEITILKC